MIFGHVRKSFLCDIKIHVFLFSFILFFIFIKWSFATFAKLDAGFLDAEVVEKRFFTVIVFSWLKYLSRKITLQAVGLL